MNEQRIKELARQAGLAQAIDFGAGFPDIEYPLGTQKFAELIIKECAAPVLNVVKPEIELVPSMAETYSKVLSTMIHAKEAKALYDQSGAEVNDFLKYKIEPQVITASTSGKRSTHYHLGGIGTFEHLDQKIKPIEKAVVAKLKELGYTAMIAKDGESYVPLGRQDDQGNGPSITNYGINIGW